MCGGLPMSEQVGWRILSWGEELAFDGSLNKVCEAKRTAGGGRPHMGDCDHLEAATADGTFPILEVAFGIIVRHRQPRAS
jgi:hypothetical protein